MEIIEKIRDEIKKIISETKIGAISNARLGNILLMLTDYDLYNKLRKEKGYFQSLETLRSVYPSPRIGDTASIGMPYPGFIARCDVDGFWTPTSDLPVAPVYDNTDYVHRSLDEVINGNKTFTSPIKAALGESPENVMILGQFFDYIKKVAEKDAELKTYIDKLNENLGKTLGTDLSTLFSKSFKIGTISTNRELDVLIIPGTYSCTIPCVDWDGVQCNNYHIDVYKEGLEFTQVRSLPLSTSTRTSLNGKYPDVWLLKSESEFNKRLEKKKNAPDGVVGLNGNNLMDTSLIPLDYRKSQGYIFNGVNQYATVPHNDKLNFGTVDFSIQCVFTISPSNVSERIIYKKDLTIGHGLDIYKTTANTIDCSIYLADGTKFDFLSNKVITKKELISLFLVVSGGKVHLYINGLLDKISNLAMSSPLDNSGNLFIASTNTNGNISLLRLFNRGLSQADVTYYENNGRPDLQRLMYADYKCTATVYYNNETIIFTNNSVGSGTSVLRNDESEPYYRATPNVGVKTSIYKSIIGEIPYKGMTFTLFVRQNSGIEQTINAYGFNSSTFNRYTLSSGVWTKISHRSAHEAAICSVALTKTDVPLDYKLLYAYNDGCVLELLPENALPDRWLESQNGLDAITTGSPAINTEAIVTDTQIVDNVTANIAVGTANKDFTIPAGYIINSLCIKSTVNLTEIKFINVTLNYPLVDTQVVNSGDTKYIPMAIAQRISSTNSIIRLNATGNGGSGFNAIINIKKCI